ncbi:MAG: type II toxin-antitoxin system VapC family toxin [Deltaproteobacteria bacterium]|nr:type II toxin-antitoxin system VapC family toxin [Deltaproteobacteria bacterium]
METVFVDTGAWLALANRSDRHHEEAAGILRDLLKGCRLLTTNLVIAESYVLILRTLGHEAALSFLDSVEGSPNTTKVLSDASLEAEASEILRKYRDQDFSYTGAVSFAVMRRNGITRAFSFDSHFITAGFTIIHL